ncbi:hypothetical protein ACQP2Y_21935 [Actinoplanes sp. CA-051413]|uniref:hypothetical protein n=1 Tax=Actinoplanes sp. CA-051413 TaxID=3239899 RepID=UPI003D99C7F2
MTAGLPVLTGREFDLVFKVSLIWAAVLVAAVLICLLAVRYWRDRALGRGPEDPMAGIDAVFSPSQERLP